MIIAFWSPQHGQCACTTNMLIYAVCSVFKHQLKVLMTHTQFGDRDLEYLLYGENEEEMISNTGFEPLLRLAKNSMLSLEDFSNYTTPILRNSSLELLSGISKDANDKKNLTEQELLVITQVLNLANELYDLVFVDLPSGFEHPVSETLIKKADLVVVNLNQNKIVLESFAKLNFDKYTKNYIVNIANYSNFAKMNLRNISSKYKLKDIISVPYEPTIIDALNSNSIIEYLGRNFMGKNNNENAFFKDVQASCKKMIAKIEMLPR